MMNPAQEGLFKEHNAARYGDNRKHQNLFLPAFLKKEAYNYRLNEEAQKNAHKIIVRWADLELTGKLEKKKETAVEAEFITEVFGEALGYTQFSENKKHWNIEYKFSVNGGEADAAIGNFDQKQKSVPVALIELKGPKTNLDKDRFKGRTAIQQCWDYLNAVPDCPWGIVSNYVSFRLYHRSKAPKSFQSFALQDLRNEELFREFYYIFSYGGLLPETIHKKSRAIQLLENTGERQKKVGNELYEYYNDNRLKLIDHLIQKPHNKIPEQAIEIAQKLIDRIIFVAFCEDRGLLPSNTISDAFSKFAPFDQVTNPRWQNFLALFASIDRGNKKIGIPAYNGGLFRKDEEVDDLELDDSWTNFFDNIGKYDFRDEVNVDVLGHLFEKSVSDIENIRNKGVFELEAEQDEIPQMAKSAERKRSGIYYTPDEFTSFIAEKAIETVIEVRFSAIAKKLKIDTKNLYTEKPSPKIAKYWRSCFDELRNIKIVDPACGSGAFLIKAYDFLETLYQDVINNMFFHENKEEQTLYNEISDFILAENLFGVDLSPQAIEITQLALWIRSAYEGKSLADLSKNIICGNSLIDDIKVDPLALDWEKTFPLVFDRKNKGFDCVIGNPPWERIKLQEREFFDIVEPEIASAVNAATRKKLIEKLRENRPKLHKKYKAAKESADQTLDFIRKSPNYPLTGKGDINTYAIFAELAKNIVSSKGIVGLLVPSGIATDHTTSNYFRDLTENKSLFALYDFENKAPIFPDVHRSFKFSIILFGGVENKYEKTDFAFFARSIEDLRNKNNHVILSSGDFKLLNPNTRTCPIFRSQKDAEITKAIYKCVPVLIDKDKGDSGNTWSIKFSRMFDQTNDAELFKTADILKSEKYKRVETRWIKGKSEFLPLYEAKMIQMYDHRAAGVVVKDSNWFRQGQTRQTLPVEYNDPLFAVEPRWWADRDVISNALGVNKPPTLLAFKNVTSPTNQRTMIAAFIPVTGVINSAPLILFTNQISSKLQSCFLANLNSFALDYIARQKIGNVNLNFFIIEQLPIFPTAFYTDRCPWNRRQTLESWISERVLKLSCTSNDMVPLAEAAGFDPPVNKWKPDERADLMAQLNAAYFLLYGISRDDTEYILSTFSGVNKEEEGLFGTYNTFDLILKYYDQFKEKSKK